MGPKIVPFSLGCTTPSHDAWRSPPCSPLSVLLVLYPPRQMLYGIHAKNVVKKLQPKYAPKDMHMEMSVLECAALCRDW